jgi:translation initiation factor aIF-2/yIF-2
MPPKPAPKISTVGKLAQERLKQIAEENSRIKALQDEEDRKVREEEEILKAEQKRIQEEKDRIAKAKQDKISAQKKAGTYMTKGQKEKAKRNKEALEKLKRSSILVSNQIVQNSGTKTDKLEQDDIEINLESNELDQVNFRSIITCIMGHVDTGKTSLLDKIRGTNVQDGEAGGITQQIGASFIPKETLQTKIIKNINNEDKEFEINVPGLLMIDTPGHEAFSNLRSRGSSLCDIAIVVIDLVHGLEPQTIQSINMLKDSGTKFIFALNKIDRLYGWVKDTDLSIQDNISKQDPNTQSEFKSRLEKIIVQIMELGFNAQLYWSNDSVEDTVHIVPTSAITGEGIGDLMYCLVNYTQNYLDDLITVTGDFKCVVMESTETEGFGMTIDAILISGKLEYGDRIILSTSSGPIQTTVKNILTPPPNRESRVKSDLVHFKVIEGAVGIKIVANNIDKVLPGTPILKLSNNNGMSREDLIAQAQDSIDLAHSSKIELDSKGVTIHASTLGSLEALVQYLRHDCNPPIPISQANIGKVMKKDVVKTSISNEKSDKEFNTILAFNVEIDPDAQTSANKCGTKIFDAEIIYHLFDKFIKYKEELFKQRKEDARLKTVFPCILKILPNCIFNKKNPLVFGVDIIEGNLHIGTPLIVHSTNTYIGKVIGIQNDKKDVQLGKKSQSVCIKVENQDNPTILYGRHFDSSIELYSKISRESNDLIKQYFEDDVSKDDIKLLSGMKKIFNIE